MTTPRNGPGELSLIDTDHDILRRLVDRLQDALNTSRTVDEIAGRQAALIAHLDAHMEFEERLMLERGYPLAFTHAQQHKAFRDQFASVFDGLASKAVTPANVGKLLLRIHDHHIKYHDEIFRLHLIDKFSLQAVSEGAGI